MHTHHWFIHNVSQVSRRVATRLFLGGTSGSFNLLKQPSSLESSPSIFAANAAFVMHSVGAAAFPPMPSSHMCSVSAEMPNRLHTDACSSRGAALGCRSPPPRPCRPGGRSRSAPDGRLCEALTCGRARGGDSGPKRRTGAA